MQKHFENKFNSLKLTKNSFKR